MMLSTAQRCEAIATLLWLALFVACNATPVTRQGLTQQRVVARTWAAPVLTVRAKVIGAFNSGRSKVPAPFNQMIVSELKPPRFPPDWLATLVDPGEFLSDYKRLAEEVRRNDLLLEEQTGDGYWPSEYATAAGTVRFRCGLILHFADAVNAATIEVYETVPSVWVGEHWALTAHGVGFGRYHDIRFVEPTMQERVRILDLIDTIINERE
jgi:hypothetical protein